MRVLTSSRRESGLRTCSQRRAGTSEESKRKEGGGEEGGGGGEEEGIEEKMREGTSTCE